MNPSEAGIICASSSSSAIETAKPPCTTGEKRRRVSDDHSWDLGLSDSILAVGLFSEDLIQGNSPNPSRKQPSGNAAEMIKSVQQQVTEESRPTKKRRESFLPMPSRRKSVIPSGLPTAYLDEPVHTKIAEAAKPTAHSRRMSVGSRFAPVVPQSSAVQDEVETKNGAITRRMSIGIGMQENNDPQKLQSVGVFAKGMKFIAQSLKSKTPEVDESGVKSVATKKNKPLQPVLVEGAPGPITDGAPRATLRVSNRRKSIATSSVKSVDMWKEF
jgi:hypothetical protein